MITLLIILLASLVISVSIYSLIHLVDIVMYLNSVPWIHSFSDWITNLPEFIQIFYQF